MENENLENEVTTDEEIEAVEQESAEQEDEAESEAETTETASKPSETKAPVSNAFTETIKQYLDSYSETDSAFKERYSNPEKNINECCNYILNQVKKSGCQGFTDDEVYKMARDYYVDEIDKNDVKAISGQVIVNHQVELTEQEKVKARVEAMKRLEQEILDEERKKREAETKAKEKEEQKAAKKEADRIRKEQEAKEKAEKQKQEDLSKGAGVQMSLFDEL